MRIKNNHIAMFGQMQNRVFAWLCLFLLLTACQHDLFFTAEEEKTEDLFSEVEEGSSSLCFTRAAANDGDVLNRVKTLRILIFDAVTGQLVRYSGVNGITVNNERFPANGYFDVNEDILINLITAPGNRHIYFVANEDSDPQLASALVSNTLTRTELLGLAAYHNPSVIIDGQTPFLMTGSILGMTINPYSHNDLLVELTRSYSKVEINFRVDDAIAGLPVDALLPSSVVGSHPRKQTYYYTLGLAPAFVTIDEISIQAPQRYKLWSSDAYPVQGFNMNSMQPAGNSISGDWIFGIRQYSTSNDSWQPLVIENYSLSYSYDTVLQCTASFYIPEYIAQDPLNEQDALKISFKVKRISFEEPSFPQGVNVQGSYASGSTASAIVTPEYLISPRTYTTALYTQYAGQENVTYSIPRNHEYIVNASLESWEDDAIKVKAGVQQWNQEYIDLEMAPVSYDWGYWLNASSMTPFGTPPGEQHSGTVSYNNPLYFGLRLSGAIGKSWRVSLSEAYSFGFTEDSQTSGIISRDATGTYIKFGVKALYPYNPNQALQTEIRVLVDNVIVNQGRYKLEQIE
jgi:hypothetical protein